MMAKPSNGRRQRQAAARHVMLTSLRALGCCCDVELVARGGDHFACHHDRGCPLEHAGRTYVMYDPNAWGCRS